MLFVTFYLSKLPPHGNNRQNRRICQHLSMWSGLEFSLFLWLAQLSQNFHPRNFPSTKLSIHTAVLSRFRPVTFAMAIFHYLHPNDSALDPRVPFLKLPLVWWLKKVSREVKRAEARQKKKKWTVLLVHCGREGKVASWQPPQQADQQGCHSQVDITSAVIKIYCRVTKFEIEFWRPNPTSHENFYPWK